MPQIIFTRKKTAQTSPAGTPSPAPAPSPSGATTSASITDFVEAAQDAAAAALLAGTHTGVTITYNDTQGKINVAASGDALQAHTQAADPHTQYATPAEALEAVAQALVSGTHTGVTVDFDQQAGTISLASEGGVPTLSRDITLTGTALGAKEAGFTFLAGTTFTDLIAAITTKVIAPTYVAPSLSISGSPAPTITEIGTNLNVTVNINFAANNSGGATAKRVVKNGSAVTIASGATAYADNIQVTGTNTSYQVQVDYASGAVLNNNVGQPDPTGSINAGSISSNTISYVGKRVAFFGTPTTTPTTSAAVRALTSTFSSDNNTTVDAGGTAIGALSPNFTITIPNGATRVVFAYPGTSRAVASVKYAQLSDSEVKGNFTESTVMVEGANGYSAIAYRVYTFVPVEPFQSAATISYKVFI